MPEDTQYNPIAEIPEAALTAAEQEWGKRPLAQMQAESIRLGGELQQIAAHGDDCLNSPILGGETASAEDRVGAMTQRIATRHFLTQRIAQAQKSERQLKAMVQNMGGDEGGDEGDLDRHLQQNLDPLGYERDRGLGHHQSAGFFGDFVHHSGLGEQGLKKNYDVVTESPLVQALATGGGLTLPMALSNRPGIELQHADGDYDLGYHRRARAGSTAGGSADPSAGALGLHSDGARGAGPVYLYPGGRVVGGGRDCCREPPRWDPAVESTVADSVAVAADKAEGSRIDRRSDVQRYT